VEQFTGTWAKVPKEAEELREWCICSVIGIYGVSVCLSNF
jgi:hypothetical protein